MNENLEGVLKNTVLKYLYDKPGLSSKGIISILEEKSIKVDYHKAMRLLVDLEDEGLILKDPDPRKASGRDVAISITKQGRDIFRFHRSYLENSEKEVFIDENSTPMSGRIDKILEDLEKLKMGNEILFEELQELKEFYTKVPDKNLNEMIKGKLFDLLVSKVVSIETVAFIWKELIGNQFRLY